MAYITPGIDGKEEEENLVPEVGPLPVPRIPGRFDVSPVKPTRPRIPGRFDVNIPRVRRPATPSIRGYAPPPGERFPYIYKGPGERGEPRHRRFERLPFESFAPLDPINTSILPTAPYVHDVYGSYIHGATYPRTMQPAEEIFYNYPPRTGPIPNRFAKQPAEEIFYDYPPIYDFRITGETEPLYEEGGYGGYTPSGGPPTYNIRYGGGGTPSSRRNYSSNLINWRV